MKTKKELRMLYLAGNLTGDDIREFFDIPGNRGVSISDLFAWDSCRYSLLGRRLGVRHKHTTRSVIGDACHIVAEHGGSLEACRELVAAKVSTLPVEDQPEAAARIEELVVNRQELDDDAEARPEKEKQFSWTDDGPGGSGWTYFAKPDGYEVYRDHKGPVLEVTEEKTGDNCNARHWKQLRFFAMVLKRALGHNGSIRLTVKLWGGKRTLHQWYGYGAQESDLREWRAEIVKIEACIKAGHFPKSADYRCDRCPLFATCDAAINYNRIRRSGAPAVILPLNVPTAASA